MTIQTSVISLSASVDRRRMMTEQLGLSDSIEWGFFDALDHTASINEVSENHTQQLREYGRNLTKGEVGCFKSHLSLVTKFAEYGTADWLLVLEDDVLFDPHFSINEVVAYADRNNVNYIRLFAKRYKKADLVGNISSRLQVIRFRTDPYGAQAYLINKKGCQLIKNHVTEITVPFDDILGRFWLHGLDAYCVFPFPAAECSVPSSLTADRQESNIMRDVFHAQHISRRVMHKFRKEWYNIRYLTRTFFKRRAARRSGQLMRK